jgi:hypothetical protein
MPDSSSLLNESKATGGHSTSRTAVLVGLYEYCLLLCVESTNHDGLQQAACYRQRIGLVFTVAPFRLNAVTP